MGQSQSNNNNQPLTGRGLHAQGTLGRSLKRVYSESSGERRCATSLSLPASPAVLKRLESSDSGTTPSTTVSTANDSESLASSSASSTAKMPLTLESVLKNFEEFAQHQWPTWAKRRGWIAEFPDSSAQAPEADDSGRVVQLDKDKWVFQRRRKKTELPPIDLNSGADRLATGRPLLEEENATDLTEKMVEILQIDETKTTAGSGTGGGQRSRRSSGYASASNSPVTKRAADQTGVVSSASPSVVISNGDASAGQCDDWQMGRMSLYEVTLRWMFDADVADDQQGRCWMDSPLKRIASSITDDDEPIDSQVAANEMNAPTAAVSSANVQDERIVRIYFHLFSRRGSHAALVNPLPSHIDFIEIPANPDDGGDDGSRAATFSSQPHHVYAPVVSHTHPPAFLPRETTCAELIRQILGLHPQLECAADKMALYEKTWQSGKTSRARLRRLNDTECPFILAKQWVNASQEESACAKSLVFQESQNGDIPWEEFSLAELTSFLRVLDREEANHELEIREKYQRISHKMRDTMQRLSPAESVHQQQ